MFENRRSAFKKHEIFAGGSPAERIESRLGEKALRWYVAEVRDDDVIVEATLAELPGKLEQRPAAGISAGRSVGVSVIPTGVGCEVGGYAGDAAVGGDRRLSGDPSQRGQRLQLYRSRGQRPVL